MKCKHIFFIVACIFLLLIAGCNNQKKMEEIDQLWALKNYGQIVKGRKGQKDVDINVCPAWKKTKGNSKIVVAVLDTGIDIENKNIKQSVLRKGNGKTEGWDFYHNDESVYDGYSDDSHGTYIANIIAGQHYKGSYYGVAPDIKVLPVKVLNGGTGTIDSIKKGIEYACLKGAKIINCSWDYTNYNKEVEDIIKSHPDVLFVCAGGKTGIDLEQNPVYPACYKSDNIISVGAVNNIGEIYDASGYGSKIDLYAPGEEIKCLIPEGDTTYVNGTSAAAAYVTGGAALVMSYNHDRTAKGVKKSLIKNSKIIKQEGDFISIRLLDIEKAINE